MEPAASIPTEPSVQPKRARAFGLDDVVVADTELSDVNGLAGTLTIRGHALAALAGKVSFEAMIALLWDGALPDREGEHAIRRRLGRARRSAHAMLERLGPALALSDPMESLRACCAHLTRGTDETSDDYAVTGALAVFAGAWAQRRRGRAPTEPDDGLSHATDTLRLLGCGADPSRVRALETYLCTVADHGLNASTFTARVVASTGSDTVSAIVAALGALKGKLHGGAPGPVLDLLDSIERPERAREVIEAELAAGRRIMGMGHRVYRQRDPRAAVLERATVELEQGLHTERLALARAVEREAEAALAARHPERALKANVEFFTAILLEAVSVPRELFTAVFAIGRVSGWCAHIGEQRRSGRIIRPAARYVGLEPPDVTIA